MIGLFFFRGLPKDQNCLSRSIKPIHIFTCFYQTLKSGLRERNTDSLLKTRICALKMSLRIDSHSRVIIQSDRTHQKTVTEGWLSINGMKLLTVCIRNFGYGVSTIVEMKSATNTREAVWAVQTLNLSALSDIFCSATLN